LYSFYNNLIHVHSCWIGKMNPFGTSSKKSDGLPGFR